jgi:hypothetical protein
MHKLPNFMMHFFLVIFVMSSITSAAQSLSGTTTSSQSKVFRVGSASRKITPPVGSIMGSSYGITVSEGVHDDLYAKALVFEKGDVRGAFVVLDVISLPHMVVMKARELIAQRTGIPASHVIMAATHAHAGPQMNPLFWDIVGGLPKQKSEEYARNLPAMIAEVVGFAEKRLQPVQVFVGSAQQKSINFNRRFLMKDGSFKMNPGSLNPNIVRPAGPVDPQVSVIEFRSLESKPVAILVNFALHAAVVGGNHFSADFPATLSASLANVHGEDLVTLFTNGTSGNVNHIDVSRRDQLSGHEESARIGTILAADVLKILPHLRSIEISSLQVRSVKVDLPVQGLQREEIKWAQQIMAQYGKASPAFSDVVKAWRIIDLATPKRNDRHEITTTVPLTDDGRALQSEVQVMALGDELALVGFPGDAFVELGLAIKQNSPFPFTVVCEQSANGTLSYVPNRKAFSEGGYEVISARFAPGGGEILTEAVIRTLIELFPLNGESRSRLKK